MTQDFKTPGVFAFIRKCLKCYSKVVHHLLAEKYSISMCSVKMKVLTLSIFRTHGTFQAQELRLVVSVSARQSPKADF